MSRSPSASSSGALAVTIGVDLGGTGTRIVTLSESGTITEQATFRTIASDPGSAVDGLIEAIRQAAGTAEVGAVGIGASGPVTVEGIIDNVATLPAFSGVDLCRMIRERTGWSCVIDNDAAAAAIGEFTYGAAQGSETCVAITLGTGIGVGIVAYGRLVRAGDGTHPEAGHIAVREAPVRCYCGLPRCWEQAASRTALEGLLNSEPHVAAATARDGDRRAAQTFERYGEHVAAGLSTLLTIFRPDRVVIGGSAAQYLDLFGAALSAALERNAPFRWSPPIVAAELGDLSGAVGAAVLAHGSAF